MARSECERRWWCATNDGSPCDCAQGKLPEFLADWFDADLDISQLPAWLGPRQYGRRMQTVELVGAWL